MCLRHSCTNRACVMHARRIRAHLHTSDQGGCASAKVFLFMCRALEGSEGNAIGIDRADAPLVAAEVKGTKHVLRHRSQAPRRSRTRATVKLSGSAVMPRAD